MQHGDIDYFKVEIVSHDDVLLFRATGTERTINAAIHGMAQDYGWETEDGDTYAVAYSLPPIEGDVYVGLAGTLQQQQRGTAASIRIRNVGDWT